MKRILALALSLALLLGCAGCSAGSRPEEPGELWVVTEKTTGDAMNYIASRLGERFAAENPGYSIRLDILPTEDMEREAYLDSLRIKIAAGEGPDVYLMPATARLVTDEPQKFTYYRLDSLFPDVNIAMGNRLFADLSGYYDEDRELGKDALPDVIMDAGVRDGKRYVLPLRFNMGAYCVMPSLLEGTGITGDCFRRDLGGCLEELLRTQDETLISGLATAHIAGFFAQPIDYEAGQIRIARDTLVRFAELKSEISRRIPYLMPPYSISGYVSSKSVSRIMPARIQTLSGYLDAAAIGKAEELEMEFLPLRSMEGSVTAEVTYYAAVDAACRRPRAAYNYLRMFLSEDAQWETLRRQPASTQYSGLLERSFPVRTGGCLDTLWDNYKMQPTRGDKGVLPKLRSVELDQADLDNLVAQIEQVYILTDTMSDLELLLPSNPTAEEIDGWLTELQYSLTEG